MIKFILSIQIITHTKTSYNLSFYKLSGKKSKYINIILNLRHVRFPPYQHLSDLRMTLCPNINEYPVGETVETEKMGVFSDLTEGIIMVLRGGLQSWEPQSWLPCCSSDCSECCPNLVVRVLIHGDGRGDERQYTQRAESKLDTSHAFSLVFSVPSVHLASPPDTGSETRILTAVVNIRTELGRVKQKSLVLVQT